MLNQEDIERFERYVSGKADEREVAIVEELFSNGHENRGLRDLLEEEWKNDIQKLAPPEVELNHLLDRIHHMIRTKENQKRKLLIYRVTKVYSKVAAILLLPLIIIGSLSLGYLVKPSLKSDDHLVSSVIHAPLGSRVSFNLPDGTVGWLNSGSSLTYSLPFNNHRNIILEGEAWFDVVHNDKSPFEIKAGNSKVKVVGTSFNVSAYQGSQYIEVVLLEGKVEFYQNTLSEKVIMLPSQKLVLRDGMVDLSVTEPLKYKAWTEGKLVFRGDDMAEVARRIERWYNVKVILADSYLERYSFRATFEDDSLDEVLRLLSLTSPIGYKISSRTVKSDGTYEKAVVTLFEKTNKKH